MKPFWEEGLEPDSGGAWERRGRVLAFPPFGRVLRGGIWEGRFGRRCDLVSCSLGAVGPTPAGRGRSLAAGGRIRIHGVSIPPGSRNEGRHVRGSPRLL